MFNIKKRNTVLCLVIYACLAVGINSKTYFGKWFKKKDKVSCATVVAVTIESLVLDKVFLLNYFL